MERRKRKPLSPKVMNELENFIKSDTKEEDRCSFTANDVSDLKDENSQRSCIIEDINMSFPNTMKKNEFVVDRKTELDINIPVSQLFLTDDNGHRHRLRFMAVFRTMKPIFIQYRDLTENLGDRKTQTPSSFFYRRMHVPVTRRLVFRRKYRISAEVWNREQSRDMRSEELKKLKTDLKKEKQTLPAKNLSVIYMKMNDMIVRLKATSLITIEQAVYSKETVSRYYEGNYAHIISNINNDIVLILIEIANPVLEPMVPIQTNAFNTYDKMVYIKYKCAFRNKAFFYSIPFSTFVYTNPVKKSFPRDWIKNPPKWLNRIRRERVGDPHKIKRQTILQQCNAIDTCWFALQSQRLRVRAQSRLFNMSIMFRRETYEEWVHGLQHTRCTNERVRRVPASCGTCKTIEMMTTKQRMWDRMITSECPPECLCLSDSSMDEKNAAIGREFSGHRFIVPTVDTIEEQRNSSEPKNSQQDD